MRALWVMALALVALAAVSRMKPAGQRRAAVVRVDHKPAPLYRAPEARRVRRSVLALAGGSVVVGAALATLAGLVFALLLNLVGDLLRS